MRKVLSGMIAAVCTLLLLPHGTIVGQINPPGGGTDLEQHFIQLDISGVPQRHRGLFESASDFWNRRITGYTSAIPRAQQQQLARAIRITATAGAVDGLGGVLGFAGPTDTATLTTQVGPFNQDRTWVISQGGQMTFDVVDLDAESELSNFATVVHEMGHALGFGSLWQQNGLIGASGNYDFDGFALAVYRAESGLLRAGSIPVEQAGGAGSAGSHWDDGVEDTDGDGNFDSFEGNLFNQVYENGSADFMLAFALQPSPNGGFIAPERWIMTDTTLASMEDVGLGTILTEDDVWGGGGIIKWEQGTPPIFFRPAVPEPGSMTILIGMSVALLARRKRS